MPIPEICKLHSQNLAHNLRLAKSDDEKRQYLSIALTAFGAQVIPLLNQLFTLHGEGHSHLENARTAALELATTICGYLVRMATDHRAAINSLEEVIDRCNDPQMRTKLVFYTNQLKKRWIVAEPGGLAHNPRAKRVRAEFRSRTPLTNYLGGAIFIGITLYLLLHLDFTAQVFPSLNKAEPPPPVLRTQVARERAVPAQLPLESPPATVGEKGSSFYSFTDNLGVVHMVDTLDKVPVEYRQNMKVETSGATADSSPVFITGNQVVVPVTITFHGRSVGARLVLDTGATVTTISEAVAAQLGVGAADVQSGTSTVADGRTIISYRFKADSVAVADHVFPNTDTSILPGSGGKGYDGLLGMNYLKNFRYHVNFERGVIEWGK